MPLRFLVAVGLSLALAAPSEAAPRLVEWSALRPPPAAEEADPFAALPDALLDALRNLVRSRALEAQGFPVTDEVRREREAWTRQVESKGASVAALLARRDAIMAQRRAAAEGTVAALDGQAVLLPGFLLPIAMKDGRATEFVFVALPGACSHVSQPPPNQVVRVRPGRAVDAGGGLRAGAGRGHAAPARVRHPRARGGRGRGGALGLRDRRRRDHARPRSRVALAPAAVVARLAGLRATGGAGPRAGAISSGASARANSRRTSARNHACAGSCVAVACQSICTS